MKKPQLTSAMRSTLQFDLDVARALSRRHIEEIEGRLKQLPNDNRSDHLVPILRLFLQLHIVRGKALTAELGLSRLQ
jgi:hypothetical protein